ncbi:MAG: TetR/AcrR family transcriptional regulator [Oscillospiraceae bacterium]|nr:TetR/AcrR family transcriptional regulator [Oscillospiraceae bacterium]
MAKKPPNVPELREKILEATLPLFNAQGLKFTMDELARSLGMSKKTIYAVFPDKRTLLEALADHGFDFIRSSKDRLLEDESLPYTEKLRLVLGTLTEKYESIDLSRLHDLREKYPTVYDRVAQRLESGWESTVALLEQGIAGGQLRPFQIPIFKVMMESTLEQFFQSDVLLRSGLSYKQALDQVVDILLRGIIAAPEEGDNHE